MEGLIGNTPLVKINYEYKGKKNSIYSKLEFYNYTGSIKDRIIDYILKENIKNGKLKKGMTLVEATSGNTGISLAALGAYYGFKVHIYMPDFVSEERRKIIELYGAKVTLISKEDGGFRKAIELVKEEVQKGAFTTNQFSNKENIIAHYLGTGKEIVEKIKADAFVSGIGTGGTLIGVGKRIKEDNPNSLIYGLEPENMTLIKGNKIGCHKIEGIGDDFIPDIVDKNLLTDVILINDNDAINMSKKIAKELGLGVGISGGANFLAAVQIQDKLNKNVVTVFPDDLKKYLSTDLSKEIKIEENFISNDIKLIDLQKI